MALSPDEAAHLRELMAVQAKADAAGLAALKELVQIELRGRDEQLVLQAAEYARRLADLNHAHQRAVATAHTYVTLDKYDANREQDTTARDVALRRADERLDEHIKTYDLNRRQVDKAIDTAAGKSSGLATGWAIVLGAVGIVSTAISLAVRVASS